MGYYRGFKSWAKLVADEARADLGLTRWNRLDPRQLAKFLDIPVLALSSMKSSAPEVVHFLVTEPESFSAVTVFDGTKRAIIHNDAHSPGRQNSNIGHELGHGLLGHPPTPPLDANGCRVWDEDVEDEANWLGGCLLVTDEMCMTIVRNRWSEEEAALKYGVSPKMIRFRVNASGARKRVHRARNYGSTRT
ncbi:ImmA/IrrE family metallo-endopeptidase [Leifsonia shinshuensis]|uniref:ImmA/IrrE family metallo-endopeptidase n=1 Tax=Leifsonia shinshuensis TaxID=150026 RepID=UPI001F50953E|nr:ImmA/IrrE family metallo-endopeptidase [Leifsonia shinshuensis]MCI0156568.1 ImmA/IrrE family metallo-endopeptidase [Leifsonia shinshuensis]